MRRTTRPTDPDSVLHFYIAVNADNHEQVNVVTIHPDQWAALPDGPEADYDLFLEEYDAALAAVARFSERAYEMVGDTVALHDLLRSLARENLKGGYIRPTTEKELNR